ncbi:MAG: hypothetical protein VX871_04780 [Pseudomonadota bacterium]|nr:hypothetical protein [Pseudomonadota bacterium]
MSGKGASKQAGRACALLTAILAMLLICLAIPARAAEPLLQLDTGGHMSLIRSLLFTRSGQLISAGDDKVIRVWDMESGLTLRTLRGHSLEGASGKIYALALSPDGRYLAVGGRMRDGAGDHPVRIYDFASGHIVALLRGHSDAVLHLDFSPDGTKLASASADDTAIVWDIANLGFLRRFSGHGGDVNAVRFVQSGGAIATVSDDNTARLWRVSDGRVIASMTGHLDKVLSIAVAPGGRVIATAGFDGAIRLWEAATGKAIRVLAYTGVEIMGIEFTRDGAAVLSVPGGKPYSPRLIDFATGKDRQVHEGHDNIVSAVAISRDGRYSATAGGSNNEIHIRDVASGTLLRKLAGDGRSVWSVGFSPDGRSIAWGNTPAANAPFDMGVLEYVLRLPEGDGPVGEPRPLGVEKKPFLRAVAQKGTLTLKHRPGGNFGYFANLDVLSGGKTVASIERGEHDGYAHNAYGFTPDGRTIIAGGGHGFLTAYDLNGRRLGEFVGHTGDVWALAVSPDGKLLLSGSDDQTVRLWNVASRENIATLFHSSTGEWVLWTPQGYYSASPEGDAHVGWQINRGEDRAAKFVTAAQLKTHFYRPDIVREALKQSSARGALQRIKAGSFSLEELFRRSPPEFAVLTPAPRSSVTQSPVDVRLRFEDGPEPVDAIDVVINGRRVAVAAQGSASERVLTLPLEAGANRIRIEARNAVGRTKREISVFLRGGVAPERRGTLHVVSIGVDDYTNFPDRSLRFAGTDAREVHRRLIAGAGPLHERVASLLLARNGDALPTAENVRNALKQLQKAGPDDTVVLFLAGHGVNDGSDYLFLPSDAQYKDSSWTKSTVLQWQALQNILQLSQGRRVMLVDTCHSGNAFNARLIKDAADASIVVLAATDADTLAEEREALGHGVFTHAVLQGLKGDADTVADGEVQAKELGAFVGKTVKRITDGKQEPVFHLSGGTDFVMVKF